MSPTSTKCLTRALTRSLSVPFLLAASDWQGQTAPDTDWTEELMRDIRFGVGFPNALSEPPGP